MKGQTLGEHVVLNAQVTDQTQRGGNNEEVIEIELFEESPPDDQPKHEEDACSDRANIPCHLIREVRAPEVSKRRERPTCLRNGQ